MLKGKLAVLCLAVASLLVLNGIAFAGIIDPCASDVVIEATGGAMAPGVNPAGFWPLFTCPQGDTDNYDDQVGGTASGVGYILRVTMIDNTAQPIPNIPGPDFWVIDCDAVNDINLCAGSASTGADSATNSSGVTTIGGSGTTTSGGWANGLSVVCQGEVISQAGTCPPGTPICLDIAFRSPDIDGSLTVNLVDLSLFAAVYPPQAYGQEGDFDINGVINLVDLAKFAFHFGPPGHTCN